jgi:lysophospholipase L1-like esterase
MLRFRVVLAAVFAAGALQAAVASSASAEYPAKMSALGDSITQAFQTCPGAFTNCPKNSWSTGTNKAVNSVFLRIKAHKSTVTATNLSVSGARVVSLNEQAKKAIKSKPGFITILIGANDACASPPTSTSSFTSSFQAAITTLKNGLPNAKLFVGSIPNLMYLWELLHTNPEAVKKWEMFTVLCPGIMTHPTSMAPEDVARRKAALNAETSYNSAIQSICGADPKCQFDGGAFFNAKFKESEVSTVDYFHPSLTGQASLAAGAWALLTF